MPRELQAVLVLLLVLALGWAGYSLLFGDDGGRHLVVAGEKASEIGVYAIDPDSGALRRVGSAPSGKGANWVEIVEFNSSVEK